MSGSGDVFPRSARAHVADGRPRHSVTSRCRRCRFTRRRSDRTHSVRGQCCAVAALDVHRLRDQLEVRRVDARPYSAKVIDLKVDGDTAEGLFVHRPMGQEAFAGEPDSTVSIGRYFATPDPASRRKVAIFFVPHSFSDLMLHLEIAYVPKDEAHRLAFYMAQPGICLPSNRGQLLASTLADAGRVGSRIFRFGLSSPMSPKVWLFFASLCRSSCPRINTCISPTPAFALHGADYNVGDVLWPTV